MVIFHCLVTIGDAVTFTYIFTHIFTSSILAKGSVSIIECTFAGIAYLALNPIWTQITITTITTTVTIMSGTVMGERTNTINVFART